MHWEILNRKQSGLLKSLEIYRRFGAYLAGGTALALQLGHRRSLDFDFYTTREFDPGLLEAAIIKEGARFKASQKTYGTLTGQINGISTSCFYYSYLLIKPLVKTEYLDLASVEDIAAMKIVAVSQRGKRRDFLDVFILAKKFGLSELIRYAHKKYAKLDDYIILRGLTYFADAEEEDARDAIDLTEPTSWEEVKTYLVRETTRLRRKIL